jgi:MSHA pilin protein MshA
VQDHHRRQLKNSGFTLIELVMVIALTGILAAAALSRFSDLSSSAKTTTIQSIAGSMRSTIGIIRSKAYAKGLSISAANPGDQSIYLVTTEAGTSEVDWRNLCPESRAELSDALEMSDHIGLSESDELGILLNNQYTKVGYEINSLAASASGCYVLYDSFGDPDCTVTVVTNDC